MSYQQSPIEKVLVHLLLNLKDGVDLTQQKPTTKPLKHPSALEIEGSRLFFHCLCLAQPLQGCAIHSFPGKQLRGSGTVPVFYSVPNTQC